MKFNKDKHTREISAKVTFTEEGTINRLEINQETGEFKAFFVDGREVPCIQSGIEIHSVDPQTDEIRRVLASIPLTPSDGAILNHTSLAAAEFDIIFAVDATPHKEIPDRCSVVIVGIVIENNGLFLSPRIFDVGGIKHNSEKVGWWIATREIFNQENYALGKKIGIITDHALGDHAVLNTYEIEIFQGWNLPRGVTLCYASQKSPSDSIFQMAIKMADKLGHDYLEFAYGQGEPPYLEAPSGAPFDKICEVERRNLKEVYKDKEVKSWI